MRARQPGVLHSRGTTTAGARHCTSLIYSGRRPNQYMQGFLVRAVGGARESDQTPAENLRSQSRPPAVRASRPRCIGARVQERWRHCQPVVVGGGAAAPIAPLPMCAFPYALLWCIESSGSSAVISGVGWRRGGPCDGRPRPMYPSCSASLCVCLHHLSVVCNRSTSSSSCRRPPMLVPSTGVQALPAMHRELGANSAVGGKGRPMRRQTAPDASSTLQC